MEKLTKNKKLCMCAACIALCYALPLAFHAVGLGSALSPMHIPVLLCGMLCGGGWGALCGLLGPILSSVLSGMPPALMLTRMIPELCAYGLLGGVVVRHVRTGKRVADLYLALATAMLGGRIVGGVATAIFYAATSGVYSLALWATSYFVESLPGIVLHMTIVPPLILMLEKARLVPAVYPTREG